MPNYLPNYYIFVDQYNHRLFNGNNSNIGVIYRNYNGLNREKELFKIAKVCKKKRYKLFVSNDIKLTIKAKADGIYIPAFNKTKRFLNFEKKNFLILGSAHNQKEIHEKISQKCKIVFLSPLFNVEKKKHFLGLHKFNFLSKLNKKTIICPLGGINAQNIYKLKLLNVKGFGGISIFKKKPAHQGAGFQRIKFL